MLLKPREKAILYITAALLCFAVSFDFIIGPFLGRNEELNRKIGISRNRLKRRVQLLGRREYIEARYAKLSDGLKATDAGEDALVATLSELESLATKANIRIVDMRHQNILQDEAVSNKELSIDLRTEADMESYLKFIYDLEHLALPLRIRKFRLNARANSQTLEGTFSISKLSIAD